ncbi:transporter substrate-binding domain-containing protein [Saccharibacillus sp. CPCC 101409]|uniref:transporter substrate-binding domain-containing protein n=1 Tax=Saccharibacillus sp. CPCC 101409 TaxID=3058041 RepID=UPI0026731CB1|nr:transporter substrate-binding domain-containing protein [Saccharibacillus sp. CPCC 101409]MDO3409121.1 transporter substrate-binding domain-containing protein [Saccharibacillus sp. CPCC 101409]
MRKRKSWLSVSALGLMLLSSGCGNGGEPAAQASASGESGAGVTKIVVGTGTAFPKVCFIDENGKLTGFDVELLRKIDELLPQYEFDFQTMDFSNLLLSLETDKIDLVAHVMEKNPEREQKYHFNAEAYAHWRNRIVVAKTNDSIRSLDDLQGKKVLTGATSAEAQILENYNKEHDKKIDIVYQSGQANDTVSQLVSGRVDATIAADFVVPVIDPQGQLKQVGEELTSDDVLYVFRKDDADSDKLSDAIDGAVKELKEDGTLSKLSVEWLGSDVTGDHAK